MSYNGQVSLNEALHPLPHLLSANCAPKHKHFAARSSSFKPMEEALLRFMAEATPNSSVMQDITQNYDEHLSRMSATTQSHFVGDGHEAPYFLIENVPDAVSPVKAKPAFIQVPKGDKTELVPVFKVCHLSVPV
jgi:extracellular elastinolytic metalloproteinase